jgi:hypothetical protein
LRRGGKSICGGAMGRNERGAAKKKKKKKKKRKKGEKE